MQKIKQCLWFDTQAEEATQFYTSLFKNSKIGKTARYGKSGAHVSGQKEGSIMTVEFELEGLTIMALNGGPIFKFTPALSFFVWCDDEKEINELWQKLSEGGEVRMGLDKYPFAQKYGFTSDKYGVNWQLILKSNSQKIAPSFLFVNQLFGKGEEAIHFYMSLFKNSKIDFITRDESTRSVMHSIFSLDGQNFVLMEGQGNHNFTFNNAFSLVITCETQQEIDHYWLKLSEGGKPEQCGWLTDKYGVSWQIVPTIIGDLAATSDSNKSERVMKVLLEMQKIDIKTLEQAAKGK